MGIKKTVLVIGHVGHSLLTAAISTVNKLDKKPEVVNVKHESEASEYNNPFMNEPINYLTITDIPKNQELIYYEQKPNYLNNHRSAGHGNKKKKRNR